MWLLCVTGVWGCVMVRDRWGCEEMYGVSMCDGLLPR